MSFKPKRGRSLALNRNVSDSYVFTQFTHQITCVIMFCFGSRSLRSLSLCFMTWLSMTVYCPIKSHSSSEQRISAFSPLKSRRLVFLQDLRARSTQKHQWLLKGLSGAKPGFQAGIKLTFTSADVESIIFFVSAQKEQKGTFFCCSS